MPPSADWASVYRWTKGLPYDEVESSLIRSYADILVFDKAQLPIVEELKEKNNTKVSSYICMEDLEATSVFLS